MAAVGLQSQAHQAVLDIVDKIRAQGVCCHVDLPEIIVAGDRSSGKSSVLEAISGLSFPTGENLCTRFVTKLTLRRSPRVHFRVSIVPDPSRPEPEQADLRLFKSSALDASNFELSQVIDEAHEVMVSSSPINDFSNDVLQIEMSGPEQPHLTLVDLPGLVPADANSQPGHDAELATDMIKRHLANPMSILLAVVSAMKTLDRQKVVDVARDLDPDGARTLGLITKPDTLEEGSECEAAHVRLAQNRQFKLRLGWHVLKNRDDQTSSATSAERDEAELAFFSRPPWTGINPSHLGVAALKSRISCMLRRQILVQLPGLLGHVSEGIQTCKEERRKLGEPRGSFDEQRRHLIHASQDFSRLMQAAVDGVYSDGFFGSSRTEEGSRLRLRAVVQTMLTDFRDTLREKGRSRQIVERRSEPRSSQARNEVLRSDYLKEVKDLMRRSRGRELPGTLNPLIIGELFAEQCRPWTAIAMHLKEDVLLAVSEMSHAVLRHVVVDETAECIVEVVDAGIDTLRQELDASFEQVLKPYSSIYPITYNRSVVRRVQRAQGERRRGEIEAYLQQARDKQVLDGLRVLSVNTDQLAAQLALQSETDLELHGSTVAVDYMEAYYDVALNTAIDAISTLAIECHLLQKLPSIFDPKTVLQMSEDRVHGLAADSEAAVKERAHYVKKLDCLENALQELKRLNTFRFVAADKKTSEPSAPLVKDHQASRSGVEASDGGQRAVTTAADEPGRETRPTQTDTFIIAEELADVAEEEQSRAEGNESPAGSASSVGDGDVPLIYAAEEDAPEGDVPPTEEDAREWYVPPAEEDAPEGGVPPTEEDVLTATSPPPEDPVQDPLNPDEPICQGDAAPQVRGDGFGYEAAEDLPMNYWGVGSKKKKKSRKKTAHFAEDEPVVVDNGSKEEPYWIE